MVPTELTTKDNLLFQSEHHPLVATEFKTCEDYCLSLIHQKAYYIAAELAQDKRVLDVGCNNGYGAAIIAQRCKSVVGVDVSDRAVESARRTCSKIPNAEFRVIDGGALPFDSGQFDLVTSFQVIEHVV